jgi:hypothetical protein
MQRLARERDAVTRQLASLRQENEGLHRDTADLLKLRSEVGNLRNEARQLGQSRTRDANDPTVVAAQAWLNRVKLLKQRFEQWSGKETLELQLLTEQDWLNETANRQLNSDADCREAMSSLRRTAKNKFASAVVEAMEQFTRSNNGQLPSDLSQLKPCLKPPLDYCLEGYEIAKPGWVSPPTPSGPWALVEKGAFTPAGIPIRDGSSLADPEYDSYIVIYQGGAYSYNAIKPSK